MRNAPTEPPLHFRRQLIKVKSMLSEQNCSRGPRLLRRRRVAVVPSSGSHPKSVTAGITGLNLDGVISVDHLRIRGLISDHILVPNVIRDTFRDGIYLVEVLGKISGSASVPANRLKRPNGGARALGFVDKSNHIDYRPVTALLQLLDGFFERVLAGIVSPIGHHQQNSLLS